MPQQMERITTMLKKDVSFCRMAFQSFGRLEMWSSLDHFTVKFAAQGRWHLRICCTLRWLKKLDQFIHQHGYLNFPVLSAGPHFKSGKALCINSGQLHFTALFLAGKATWIKVTFSLLKWLVLLQKYFNKKEKGFVSKYDMVGILLDNFCD